VMADGLIRKELPKHATQIYVSEILESGIGFTRFQGPCSFIPREGEQLHLLGTDFRVTKVSYILTDRHDSFDGVMIAVVRA